MKFYYYLILLFLFSCLNDNSKMKNHFYYKLNEEFVLKCDSNFKYKITDRIKSHNDEYNILILSNNSKENKIYITSLLIKEKNKDIFLRNFHDSMLNYFKYSFIDGFPDGNYGKIKPDNIDFDTCFKIGENCFYKLSYSNVKTWLFGTQENYSYSISLYKDTNDVYLNSLIKIYSNNLH